MVKKVMRVLSQEGFVAGGVFCPEIRDVKGRLGFEIIDVLTGEKGILSHIHHANGPRIGKYRVNLLDLTRIGVHAIESAIEKTDYIVIDEVGPMELQGMKFQQAVLRALNSPKPVLGVLHWKMRHPIIQMITAHRNVRVFELTKQNRQFIHQSLSNELRKTLESKK